MYRRQGGVMSITFGQIEENHSEVLSVKPVQARSVETLIEKGYPVATEYPINALSVRVVLGLEMV